MRPGTESCRAEAGKAEAAAAGPRSAAAALLCRGQSPQSTEVPYLDHGEPENEPIEKVYVTTLVTPMGLFNYVDGINSKITPKK